MASNKKLKRELEFKKPPQLKNDSGKDRRVGLEIEFAAEEAREIALIVKELYGGTLEKESEHRFRVQDTRLGKFTIELDTQYAHADLSAKKPKPDEHPLNAWVDFEIEKYFRTLIGDVTKAVVPFEVVTPPIKIEELSELNAMTDRLRKIGAKGTDEALVYAFGMHINPEVVSTKVSSILNHLRAFLLLSDWLHEKIDVDVSRRISPYINRFPKSYAMDILDWGYTPDMPTFIDDYLDANLTRNRELDLIPLLMHIDSDRVSRRLQDGLSSARPTFHYRLPDCRLNDPLWSMAKEWNLWVEVERLADNEEALKSFGRAYIDHHDELFPGNWVKEMQQWFSS